MTYPTRSEKEVVVPEYSEIDCMHWLWPDREAVIGIDVPHWFTNQGEEDD